MAEFIVMPKLGFDMREGVLVTWNRAVGDQIEKGEVIAEIESDKATLELEAQAGGTLLKLLAGEGDVVPIGSNLAIVGDEGEDISGLDAASNGGPSQDEQPEEKAAVTATPSAVGHTPVAAESGEFPAGIKATPVARRIALEKGIDLRRVNGSGPNGRIRKADVENYRPGAPTLAPATLTPARVGPES